jgi:hypothetical protein
MLSGCPVPDRPDQSDGSGTTILLSEARKAEVAESYLVAETEVLAGVKHFLDPAASIGPRAGMKGIPNTPPRFSTFGAVTRRRTLAL